MTGPLQFATHAEWEAAAIAQIAADGGRSRSADSPLARVVRAATPGGAWDGSEWWDRKWDDLHAEAQRRTRVATYRQMAAAALDGAREEVWRIGTAADDLMRNGDWTLVATRGRAEDLAAALQQARVALAAVHALLPGDTDPVADPRDPEE